ncbi:Nuclear Hormone Receptor family [Caenorhabditis elegans]|uniref:Nuclear Hormone Receptor family n=1 Tax=Caenorhabditis elegans TaxID=6239 RepID=Q20389_CAEEL|nr:Nuclear Hormone Receptor family [Caenorhabditis elegans]CCD71203.1 Nuclear Hormone Receptor family [Caenorhabditis elegans]|eukprot:NP_504683.1 Nuclear Hormone Receptor family [Caenorhabditis elegans]
MVPDKSCLVCKKASNGMHFGALTCRACAAFFRRATVLKLQYKCKQGNSKCNIDGRGRYVCRQCRLTKCKAIGMNEEKVQLDYDPTYSFRGLMEDSGSDEFSTPNGSPAQSDYSPTNLSRKNSVESPGIDPNFLFTFSPKTPDKPNMVISFNDLVKKIETSFSHKTKGDDCELTTLTSALKKFRKNQKAQSQISFLDKVELKSAIDWLNDRIYMYSCWFSSSKSLMSLPMDQKMQLFRSSWNVVRTFERLEMSVKIFEEGVIRGGYILINDDLAMKLESTHIDFASITDLTNQYFNKLFEPFLHRYIDEVARPLLDLKPTTEEVVFCMVHLIGLEEGDLSHETREACEQMRAEIADQMHVYYTNRTDIKMYSHRLLILMKLVKSMKRISREKSKIKELFWLFDIFHAEISEPYFFEMF